MLSGSYFGVLFALCSCTPAELQQALGTLATITGEVTSEEAGAGLKQALEFGIGKGAELLSKEDGYYKSAYKILLPEEARKLTDKLQNVPGFKGFEEIYFRKNKPRGRGCLPKELNPFLWMPFVK